eukprot:UC1_evm1s129
MADEAARGVVREEEEAKGGSNLSSGEAAKKKSSSLKEDQSENIVEHKYGVTVIGAGSGGVSAAVYAAKLGSKVALVESDTLGGDSVWTSSAPSKALVKVAKIAHVAKNASKFGIMGIDSALVRPDMAKVAADLKECSWLVSKHLTKEELEAKKVDVHMGRARFIDKHKLEITPKDGSPIYVLTSRWFLITTGAEVSVLRRN